MDAHGVQSFQISGGPDWFESQRFQIDARSGAPAGDDQLRMMLGTLLQDRFHLVFHRETRQAVGYAIVLAKGGLKIKQNEAGGGSTTHHSENGFNAINMSMARLAMTLAEVLRTPVSDGTAVEGVFEIALKWAPEETRARVDDNGRPAPAANPSTLPSLPEALEQQLGLKLESRKVSMEVLIVDHAEKPVEN